MNEPLYRVWDNDKIWYQALWKNEKGNLVVERCTGLKDSTDKWIFEGDNIEFQYHTLVEPIHECGTLIFDRGVFYVESGENIFKIDRIFDIKIIGTKHDE